MKRVHEVAKELNLSSRALLKLLRQLNFEVTSPMSPISSHTIKACKEYLESNKEALKLKDIEKKKLIAQVRGFPHETRKERELQRRERAEKKVRETITKIEMGERIKKYKPAKPSEVKEERPPKKIRIGELTSIRELASMLSIDPLNLISKCLELGLMVTINQRITFDTAFTIASEYGYEAELISTYIEKEEISEKLEIRPPVVTVMGHVDHGKTTLLDYIRHTNVVKSESGGITQHIGAYKVKVGDKSITFIDTPGHEAFTAMRARGARVTDIVVLVIAADDGIMPQTVEALNHAKDAGVPIVVAINKIDISNTEPDKVERQLLDYNLVTERYGGDILCCRISAKTGEGVKNLLETILMQAELLELYSTSQGETRGVIIESKMDKGKGPMATAIISRGILKVGDSLAAGGVSGRVRALYDEWGKRRSKAYLSEPIQIVGFDELPQVGDTFRVFKDERVAREISKRQRESIKEELGKSRVSLVTPETIQKELQTSKIKELKVIIKGDAAGSIEALSDSLEHLTEEEGVRVNVIHKGVGEINESDILLAAAGGAIVIGYNTRENLAAEKLAKDKGVEIHTYNVIYEAIDEMKLAMKGLLPPKFEEYGIGRAEVKKIFKIKDIGFIVGCSVLEGKIIRGEKVRVKRNGIVVHEGKIGSLKRIKEDVNEVEAGLECGVGFGESVKLECGDILEIYGIKEIPRS
ncbi:MAG: translation initiation factor IF-2 [bacterium]|nr:translation initiation factor IF-2 [bacterium]